MSTTITKTSATNCSDEEVEIRRGPWTVEEDTLLIHYIACHGEGRWNVLANRSGLKRSGKSCRLRWLNYLSPDVKRGNLTPQEQLLILQLHSKWGNRWSKIAQHLPGRTDNEIKNYWRTRVQKVLRHGTAIQEAIQCLSIPLNQTSLPTPPPPPPPQVHAQAPLNFDYDDQKISSSQNCISPSIVISDQFMDFSQITEYPTSPFHAMGNDDYSTFLQCCYNVDTISSFDVETYSPAAMPMGEFRGPIGNCIAEEQNRIEDYTQDSFWNMDELWQL